MLLHEGRIPHQGCRVPRRHQGTSSDNDRVTNSRLRKNSRLGQVGDVRDAAEPNDAQQELHNFRLAGMSGKQLANFFSEIRTRETPQAVLVKHRRAFATRKTRHDPAQQ